MAQGAWECHNTNVWLVAISPLRYRMLRGRGWRELREVGEELAMLTPTYHGMPFSAQQWADGSEAVLLSSGGISGASPPAVGPML